MCNKAEERPPVGTFSGAWIPRVPLWPWPGRLGRKGRVTMTVYRVPLTDTAIFLSAGHRGGRGERRPRAKVADLSIDLQRKWGRRRRLSSPPLVVSICWELLWMIADRAKRCCQPLNINFIICTTALWQCRVFWSILKSDIFMCIIYNIHQSLQSRLKLHWP